MGKAIHWDLCRKKGFATTDKWYEHELQPVTENEKFKILWDFTVQTDHIVEARRPDMMIIDKENKLCLIVDFAVPSDHLIEIKEREKIEKYQDPKREVQKLWNMKAKIIPIVIGALGTIPKTLQKQLEQIESGIAINQIQTTVHCKNTTKGPGNLRRLVVTRRSEH